MITRSTKKLLINTILLLSAGYIVLCALLFFFQEKLIFFPEKLDRDFKFDFNGNFEEIDIPTDDHRSLHGILFRAGNSKGLIFYLHGNAGSSHSWGDVKDVYIQHGFDVFIFDYRGYGKSEGSIRNEKEFFRDAQLAYDTMKSRYRENNIIVLGYSIGTGTAAMLASSNQPALLILQAPYYNLTDMMRRRFPIIPTFILKYKFGTNEFLQACKMPVVIFHGDRDEVIYYGSSLKLKKHLKQGDTLITLTGQSHNGITENDHYKNEIRRILTSYHGKDSTENKY